MLRARWLTMAGLVLAITTAADAAKLPTKPVLTLELATKVVDAAEAAARRLGAPGGSIAVVDDGGHLVVLRRLDGTLPATPPVAIGKARTAALFRQPTANFERIVSQGRTPMLNIADFMPMQGGVPLRADGHVIGAIGVSGAASAQQDTEIAEAALKSVGTVQ